MKFIMKLKIATWIFAALFAAVAPSAWADCPTHATYPTQVEPNPKSPTDPGDCEGVGSAGSPPPGIPSEPGASPTPAPPVLPTESGSGDSCPITPPPPPPLPPLPPPPPGNECPTAEGSPDSLPTVGERVRLHVVGGGGAVPVRWGKTVAFGDGFRLNYLSYFQYTAEGLYARLYDPAGQTVHNFRTDPDAATTRTETIAIDGESYTVREYSDCYRGEMPDMNRVTIKTYTRANGDRPDRMELVYPEGGMLHYEFDSYEPIVGDLAGPLYRIAKRVTKEGHAVTFTYSADRLVIRDASGNEYVCHLDADKHIVKIAIASSGETRTWSYTYTTGKIIETNDQTGIKMEMRGTNYVTNTYFTAPNNQSHSSSYARDAKGNLTSMNQRGDTRSYRVTTLPSGNTQQVETRDGRTITREFDANGLLWQENSLGGREEFRYDQAKRLTYYKNALGHEWRHEYSNPGSTGVLLRSLLPDGGETQYDYHPGTDLVSQQRSKLEDGNWQVVSYSYDARQRLVEERRQLENGAVGVTRYVRRPDGSVSYVLVKVDDSSWAATYYEYNAANQPTLIKGPYYVSDPEHPETGLPAVGKVYAYDVWGNRVSDTDELGNVARYEYDGGNRIVARVNPLGQRTEYVYDGLGHLVKQIDTLGNQTEWTYTNGRVYTVKGSAGAAGCSTCALAAGTTDMPGSYSWSISGLLMSFTDLEGKVTRYEYDAARRKSKETDPLGNVTLFGYDAVGNLASVTDPLGNSTRYAYDPMGRQISTTDPLGNVSGVEYDPAGRAVRIFDAGGGERVMTYDAESRLVAARVKVDGTTWRETRYSHDLRGRMVERTEAFGTADAVVTRFSYDAAGLPVRTVLDPSGLNIVQENAYDLAGRLVEIRDGNGEPTRLAYDAAGNLLSVTTPEGRTTAFAYDDVGRRIEAVLDPEGVAQGVYVAYDAAGRVVDESNGVAARSYVYDKVGRRTRILTPGQTDVSLVYDAVGNLLETRRLTVSGAVATAAKREYDKAGRVVKTADEAGKATLYEYDAAGRPVKITDPFGAETLCEYDAAGRASKLTLPHGGERLYFYNLAGELVRAEGGPEGTVLLRYDGLGRQVESIDANGRSRKATYDLAGRVVRMENEMGQPVVYAYDQAGNRLSLADAKSNVTVFEYDRDGNVVSMTYPPVPGQPENVERYLYDAVGRLVCKTTPNGDRIRSLYDPAGNIAAVYHGDEASDVDSIPVAGLIAKYERNGAGSVTREEDGLTAMLYSFDTFGRLTEARDNSLGKSVRYGYDVRDLRTKVEVVDYSSSQKGVVSMTVAYGYDDAGRLATVKKDADPASTYEYDLSGRRTKLVLPNGVSTEYTYDSADRLLDLTTRKDATVLAKFAYSHDLSGNRTGITYADGSRSLYEFDQAYRLTRDLRVDSSNQTQYDESYTYDSLGNRLTKVRTIWNPVSVSYSYNARNQLVASAGTENQTYSYDANGNLTGVLSGIANEERTYDVLNRLKRYSGPAGVEESTYFGAGWERMSVNATPSGSAVPETTRFLYDGDNVVADFNGASSLQALYVTPFLDENLSVNRLGGSDAGAYYYSQDGLGSVRSLTTQSGDAVNRYDYTAFGEGVSSSIGVSQRYGYTGRETNALNSTMYYRYRNYLAGTGRFVWRDPIGYGADIFGNLYTYVYNQPHRYIDPMGLILKISGTPAFKTKAFNDLVASCSAITISSTLSDVWTIGMLSSWDCKSTACSRLRDVIDNPKVLTLKETPLPGVDFYEPLEAGGEMYFEKVGEEYKPIPGPGVSGTNYLDTRPMIEVHDGKAVIIPSYIKTLHEILHGREGLRGELINSDQRVTYDFGNDVVIKDLLVRELFVVSDEQKIRKEGDVPPRKVK